MPSGRALNLLLRVAAAPLPGRPSGLRERMRREAVALALSENLADAAWSYRIVPLEARVTTLFGEKRASLALALDGLGNELLFATSRWVQDHMLADAKRQQLT